MPSSYTNIYFIQQRKRNCISHMGYLIIILVIVPICLVFHPGQESFCWTHTRFVNTFSKSDNFLTLYVRVAVSFDAHLFPQAGNNIKQISPTQKSNIRKQRVTTSARPALRAYKAGADRRKSSLIKINNNQL